MTKLLLLTVMFINLSLTAKAFAFSTDKLISFDTDFCTGYAEGTSAEPQLWKHCCLEHDLYFWAGGDKDDRYVADQRLRSCINQTGNYLQAKLIYFAVRAGSYSPIKFPGKKWNFGWPERPSHQALTPEDIDAIETELQHPQYIYLSDELKISLMTELRSR